MTNFVITLTAELRQTTQAALLTKKAKKVPPELIQGFLSGDKNPVSALMEYSAMSRLHTTFQECNPTNPGLGMRYDIYSFQLKHL